MSSVSAASNAFLMPELNEHNRLRSPHSKHIYKIAYTGEAHGGAKVRVIEKHIEQ